MLKHVFFQSVYSQLNHCMRDSQITRSKISYNSIEPQPLPCTPACVHEFHALALTPHHTFTAPLVGSAFRIQSEVCGRAFLRIKAVGCLCKGGAVFDAGQFCHRRWFAPLLSHKEIFNSSCFLIVLIHTKYKINKENSSSEYIRKKNSKPNIEFLECNPADILFSWRNAT